MGRDAPRPRLSAPVVDEFQPQVAAAPSQTLREAGSARRIRIEWRPEWGEISAAEVVTMAISGAVALTTNVVSPGGDHWRRSSGVDEDVRDALRASTETKRRLAREVSDVFLVLMASYPYVVDSLIVAGWYRDSPKVARRMALINLETQLATTAIHGLANLIASRERPYGRDCGGELSATNRDCAGSKRFRSFFSGHTAHAFAAAALTCSHHANLDLYQSDTASALTCATGMVIAAATGTLRIVGDQHYLSDVGVGAVVGTLMGLGLPWLLHYGREPSAPADEPAAAHIQIVPSLNGAALMGAF